MRILRATTTEGKPEVFNLDKILNIAPHGENIKILMGAGLYWFVERDSIIIEDIEYKDLEKLIKGGGVL